MKWSTAFKIIGIYAVGWGICFGYVRIRDRWVEAHRPPPQTEAEIQADVDRMVAESKTEAAKNKKVWNEKMRRTYCSINVEHATTYQLLPAPGTSVGANAIDWDRYDRLYDACIENPNDPLGKYVEYQAK